MGKRTDFFQSIELVVGRAGPHSHLVTLWATTDDRGRRTRVQVGGGEVRPVDAPTDAAGMVLLLQRALAELEKNPQPWHRR